MKKIISLLMAFCILAGLLPPMAISANAADAADSGLAGKTVSILGDSISTYTSVSNNTNYNSTIGSNKVYYSAGTLGVYQEDTWWQQTLDALGMELCVNNSWSGSAIFGTRAGTAGAYLDRCVQLHNDNTGEEPDIIFVFLGTNDFSYTYEGGELGNYDLGLDDEIEFSALIQENEDGSFTYEAPATSPEAYAIMLHKMQQRYPDAQIYCMSLMTRRYPVHSKADVGQPTEFNAKLKEVADELGAYYIELEGLFSSDPVEFDLYMGDKRVHPNAEGMDKMTQAVISALTGENATVHSVTAELTNVSLEGSRIALAGKEYTAALTETNGFEGMEVSVTMGGVDVTASCYENGMITIASVTGDIIITASALEREPKKFRWEYTDGELVCAAEEGDANALTRLAGTTADGVFTNTRYQLEQTVVLRHDLPWILEWKGEGTGGFMLAENSNSAQAPFFFRRAGNFLNAFGDHDGSRFNNYGIALNTTDIDGSAEHVYRLENRIADDGTNMVWLYVDGAEVGALNNYYVGGTAQGTTGDWVCGKDFSINYIGSSSHPLTDYAMEYLLIDESVHTHTYENGICTTCGDTLKGKKVSILSASTSTYDGVSNNTAANSTIGDNAVYYTEGRHGVYLKDTWWQQTIDALGMRLLVNNSWSGSCVFQPRRGEASVGYGDRAVNLHNDHTGEEPDIIWVFLGTNDFAYYKDTFGKAADVDYSALIKDNGDGTFTYAAPTSTCEAYAIMLHKIETRYPDAEVYCMTAVARRDPDYAEDNRPDPGQPTAYNAELIKVAAYFGCPVIDLEDCIPKDAELFDKYIGDKRAHPNPLGMDLMSQRVISAMLGRETKLCDVSGTYSGVYTDNPAAAAIEGMAYQAKLTADQGSSNLEVTVTMGGVDVTGSVYTNGAIHIETVTGDIEITAIAYREAKEFRWEVVDGQLVSTGKDENSLTALAETITDGVIKEGKYQFAIPVILKHDQPWVMAWKCAEDWRGILLTTNLDKQTTNRFFLARTKGGQLCFGTWNGTQNNNYGVDLSDLDGQTHVYRLENRIAADGSNMVWLYLDGVEIGPMNNYFISSKDQGATSDWISGKNFVFPYIGMDHNPLNNCRLDYLAVWEEGHTHTYENGICTGCGDIRVEVTVRGDAGKYTVDGQTVTVTHDKPCRVGCLDEASGKYIAITAVADQAGSYRFTAPKGVTEVLIVLKGDVNHDGRITAPDIARMNAHIKGATSLTAEELFAADVNGDGQVDNDDILYLTNAILGKSGSFLTWEVA